MRAPLWTLAGCLLLAQATRPAPAPSLPKPADAPPKAAEDIEVRYARSQLQLAEANLKRMQDMNVRQARSVPTSILEEYQQDVELSRVRLQQAQVGSAENVFQTWLRRAELAAQTADTSWKNGLTVNQRTPGTFATLDIERFRLRAEIARLQFERGKLLAAASHDSQLQWELDCLNGEVQRLKEQTTRIPVFSRFYPW
jgi:hypothetical protein